MSGRRSFLPLSGSHRFDAVFQDGARVRSGGITMIAAPRHDGPTRVGLVAGRRVGGAVARNRAKRRLRAVLDRTELPGSLDLVVIASPEVVDVPFGTLTRWLQDGLSRALARAAE